MTIRTHEELALKRALQVLVALNGVSTNAARRGRVEMAEDSNTIKVVFGNDAGSLKDLCKLADSLHAGGLLEGARDSDTNYESIKKRYSPVTKTLRQADGPITIGDNINIGGDNHGLVLTLTSSKSLGELLDGVNLSVQLAHFEIDKQDAKRTGNWIEKVQGSEPPPATMLARIEDKPTPPVSDIERVSAYLKDKINEEFPKNHPQVTYDPANILGMPAFTVKFYHRPTDSLVPVEHFLNKHIRPMIPDGGTFRVARDTARNQVEFRVAGTPETVLEHIQTRDPFGYEKAIESASRGSKILTM